MTTSYFDALLDGESFIVLLDSDPFYKERGTYYVFEKTCPQSVYMGRKSIVFNGKRLPDGCLCSIPGHYPVVRVGAFHWQFAGQWNFEGAKKAEPQMEIDYGDTPDADE